MQQSQDTNLNCYPAGNKAYSFTSRISAAGELVAMNIWAIASRLRITRVSITNIIIAARSGNLSCTFYWSNLTASADVTRVLVPELSI